MPLYIDIITAVPDKGGDSWLRLDETQNIAAQKLKALFITPNITPGK